jgi:predicted acetyltransferase
MALETLRVVEPDIELKNEFFRYCDAFLSANEPPRLGEDLARRDFQHYIRTLKDASNGIGLQPGWVAYTTYWLIRADRSVIGNSSLRHWLTPALEDLGGHIGYSIHPQERRKGYGTSLLRLMLEKAREKGMSKVLITCNTDNIASSRVILNNGGVLSSQGVSPQSGVLVSRYWISL